MVKCLACGAEYEPVQGDGLLYFHVCPPLSRSEVAGLLAVGKLAYAKGKTIDDYIAIAAATGVPVDQAPLLAADDLLATATYERGNKRDENVLSIAEEHAGVLKSEGAGVVEIASKPAAIVVVK